MTRALSLLLVLTSACSAQLDDPSAPPPATVRERLETPTRLQITSADSGGAITAARKVGTGWDTGLVDLAIENGELIVSSDARDALTIEGLQVTFKPLELPDGMFGDTDAAITDVRIDLTNELRTPATWSSNNEVHLTAMLDITLSWSLKLGGSPAPLGSPKLPPVAVDITLTGDGTQVTAAFAAKAPGELWTWAGLVKLRELELGLGAAFPAP